MIHRLLHMTLSSRKKLYAWYLLGALVLSCLSLPAQQPSPREYQVKAVFLYNFTQFVEWPPSAFAGASAPLTIGVLGGDPFGTFLDELVRGERVHGRPITVRRFREAEDVRDCHILFVNGQTNIDAALRALRGQPVLTVSDAPAFLKKGGMIRLYTESNKIRLQIRPEAARAAHLGISSKLLRVAEVVD